MKNYFEVNQHAMRTRNQNLMIKLPTIKLELGRQTSLYTGAKVFNDLPINLRKEKDFLTHCLDSHVFLTNFNKAFSFLLFLL